MKNWCLLSNDPSHTVCLELIWGWFFILHLFFRCAELRKFWWSNVSRSQQSWRSYRLAYVHVLFIFRFSFSAFRIGYTSLYMKNLVFNWGVQHLDLCRTFACTSTFFWPCNTCRDRHCAGTRVFCTQNASPDSETWRKWSSWLQRDHMLVLGFPPAVEDSLVSRLPMRVFWGFLWLIFSLFSFSFFVFSLTTFSPYTLLSYMLDGG